jgi:crotonobetaine/carnitine-CoA ligase
VPWGQPNGFVEGDRLVNRYANGLTDLGIKAGDVVAMVMEPSIEVVLIAFAAARVGAVFTTISTDFSGRFLAEALEAPEPSVLIIDQYLAGRLDSLPHVGGASHVFVNGSDIEAGKWKARPLAELLSGDASPPAHVAHWLDPVQVWWSSGTTGKPKGVTHTHSSLLMQVLSHDRDIRPGDTLYSCTPFYLGSGWTGTVYPSLVMGVRGAIDAKFSVSRFWDRVNKYQATHAFTLGAMHMHLWNAPEKSCDANNSLRRFAAMPMASDLIPHFKKRFGIEDMRQGYGTSETFRVFDEPESAVREGAVLGYPVKHLEVVLMDEEDRPVKEGEAGEICVRPREPGLIFCGYFKDPDRTVEAWRSMWHHTGDMAFKGEDGLYRFADRKKDYIRYKGRNMSMFEVEAVVSAHPAVKDVAAFGIQSAELESESELMISVILAEGQSASPEDLARFINQEAPYYFVPRYIDIVAELPRNDHGRLMKNDLRDRGVTDTTWDREATDFEIVRP